MGKILDYILSKRKKSMAEYEENKEAFEKVMGRPSIEISVELPEGCEGQREDFLNLEKEDAFLKDVDKLVKKHLKKKKKMHDKLRKE